MTKDNGDSRLGWVQKNRSRTPTAKNPGTAAVEWLMREVSAGAGLRSRVAAEIVSLVDDDFVEHCKLGAFDRGVVRICVEEPQRLALLRLRWMFPLKHHLQERIRGTVIREVVFESNSGGSALDVY